jgi:ATP-binding cassette subfamily B multidrug efflux pump
MEVFKQLKQFYWGHKVFLFASIICLIIATGFGLVYPLLLRYLIDDVIIKEQFHQVPYLALSVFAVMSIKAGFQFLHGLAGGRLGNRVAFNMRDALYQKLQYLSFQYYDRARTGDIMSRLTADLEAIRNFLGFGLAQLLNMFIMVVLGTTVMAFINWQLTIITMVTMPVMAFLAIRFERQVHPAFRSIRMAMSHLTTAVQENITGVRTVKSFAKEAHEVDKFSVRNEEYKSNHIETAGIWAKFFPAMEWTANLSVVILLAVGGYLVIEGSLLLGELVAFLSLIWFIIGPMWQLGFHINNYTQSKASGERILELLHQPQHVKDRPNAMALDGSEIKGAIKFEDVTFAYPDNQSALHNIYIDAPAGSTIGILGGTGSGKSTIIQLLLRAYDIKQGRITLDGIDTKGITLDSLRKQIALVFQETFLFSSTIRNNIAYGVKDTSMEDIIKAAKLAQAHDFIMELPLGYDTIVGERGLGLSGGQKQRIAIARALIKNPKILVLDDSTSAVDMETEHSIQEGLKEVMEGRTTFIIAHRISSLKHADEIIVLDQGRIVQRGTHGKLLSQTGPYLETYNIQYSDRPKQVQAEEKRGLAH